jgi:hypothetical protein
MNPTSCPSPSVSMWRSFAQSHHRLLAVYTNAQRKVVCKSWKAIPSIAWSQRKTSAGCSEEATALAFRISWLWMRLQTPDKPARLEGATKGVNGWIVLALITKTADSASRRIQRWPSNPLVNTASGVTQGRGPLGLSIAIRHTSSTCLCWRPGLRKPVSRATMHSQTPSNVLSNASTLASPMDALRFVFTTAGHRSGEQQRQRRWFLFSFHKLH